MSEIILSAYFSKNPHPNDRADREVVGRADDGRVWQNDFRYIKDWYNSIVSLDLEAAVFYDNLTDDFVEKYTTPKIRFIKVPPTDMGYNCYRHFVFKDFLQKEKYDFVFHTDISDVVVVQNPSKIFDQCPHKYFVGRDSIQLKQFPALIYCASLFGWNSIQLMMLSEEPLANMGVFGARHEDALAFYSKMCEVREPTLAEHATLNADMMVGNHVIYNNLICDRSKFLVGHPLTSDFKRHQKTRNDVYFIHK